MLTAPGARRDRAPVRLRGPGEEDTAEVVLDYIRWERRNPLPADVATAAVLAEVRDRLDAACPKWRWAAFQENPQPFTALVVEVRQSSGWELCGALTQRLSPAGNGAA